MSDETYEHSQLSFDDMFPLAFEKKPEAEGLTQLNAGQLFSALGNDRVHFLLDLTTDPWARVAMAEYAAACAYERPELAKSIEDLLATLQRNDG